MRKRRRNTRIEFYVTDEENELINQRINQTGFSDRSSYLRKCAIDVSLIQVDTSALIQEINELSKQISKIGTNINQIARFVNADGKINSDEMKQLLSYMKKLTELNKKYSNEVNEAIQLNSEYEEE